MCTEGFPIDGLGASGDDGQGVTLIMREPKYGYKYQDNTSVLDGGRYREGGGVIA